MALATSETGTNWIIRLAIAVLVLALGYMIVKTIITFTNPEAVWKQPSISPVTTQSAVSRGTQNFNFTTDPFNRAAINEPDVVEDFGEDAPETTLNLKLTGRTAGTNGTAILRTPDNKEGNYRLGDEIVSGVTLQAVNRDFIVLDVDGQMQRLTFARGNETGLMVKSEDADTPPSKLSVKAPSDALANVSPQSPEISGDVSTLFQNISLRRIMKNGQLTGYSVRANRAGVDLSQYGFSKGDVVTAIGGTDITRGRPDFLALFENAAQSGGTDVTVLRNGKVKIIKLGTP